ncbi:MAG: nucleotidyl transferase AbiEii/AbiGii toxin family protein [bacterium]|nr:nucleotidyl transferase AbiEii/AbiGii toxin family protein [bacterium]
MGNDANINPVMPEALHLNVLPSKTREAFLICTTFDWLLDTWYLAGGTALALQAGHRQSVDLDFFTMQSDFDTATVERRLVVSGGWVTTFSERGTLYGLLNGAKMSFIAYPFFRPSPEQLRCGFVRLLIPDDIAAMKIIAISQRGKKRDFADLYWYTVVHGASLEAAIERAIAQYPEQKHSIPHFLKSLTYFNDAEDDPMPVLNFKADWEGVKAYFRKEVPAIAKKLLRLEEAA